MIIEFIFYVIAFLALIILFRDNSKCRSKLKEIEASNETLTKENQKYQKINLEISEDAIKIKKRFQDTKRLIDENKKLKLLLKQIRSSIVNNFSTANQEVDQLLKEEYQLLKEEEELVKEESDLLVEDNKLLQEEKRLLQAQIVNYQKQIDELRVATEKQHEYLEMIDKLNKKIEELSSKNDSIN